jgi:hypothetical protein
VHALLVEVARAQEAATAVEAAHVTAILAVETSTKEAATAQDSAALHIEDEEDRATLVEMEARERVLRVEAENAATLDSTRQDTEGLVQKIALLEGELAEECRARKLAEEDSRSLSDTAPNINGRFLRGSIGCNSRSSPFYRPKAPNCTLPLSVRHGEESPIRGDVTHGPPPY